MWSKFGLRLRRTSSRLVLAATGGRGSLHRDCFVDGPNPEQEDEECADRKGRFVTDHSLTEDRQNTAAEDDKNDTQAAEEPAHWLSRGPWPLPMQQVVGVERDDPAVRRDEVDARAFDPGQAEVEAVEEGDDRHPEHLVVAERGR